MIQIYLNILRNTAWFFPRVLLTEKMIVYSDTFRNISWDLSGIILPYNIIPE